MNIHTETIRCIFNWILKDEDYETFLRLRSVNKTWNRIGLQQFNTVYRVLIEGKSSFISMNTCMSCYKRSDSIWMLSIPKRGVLSSLFVFCNKLKCKMNIIRSYIDLIKTGKTYLKISVSSDKVKIIRSSGDLEDNWGLEQGLYYQNQLHILFGRDFSTKYIPYFILKGINDNLFICFEKPLFIDDLWIRKIEEKNIGVKFDTNFKNIFERKYSPN